MTNLFKIHPESKKELQRIYRDSPKKFGYATADMLNKEAFSFRRAMINTVHQEMEVRNKGFVKVSVRVKKTFGNIPINKQRTNAGSIERKGFSGWVEQQFGTASDKSTVTTEAARGGSWTAKVKRKNRMNKAATFRRPRDNFGFKTYGQKVVSMLKAKSNVPFIVEKGGGPGRLANLKPGVWTNEGGTIRRIQTFGKKWKPKRVDLLGLSMRKLEKDFNLNAEWEKSLKRQFSGRRR